MSWVRSALHDRDRIDGDIGALRDKIARLKCEQLDIDAVVIKRLASDGRYDLLTVNWSRVRRALRSGDL